MKTVYELIVIVAVALTWLFVYQNYWDDIKMFLYSGQPVYVIHIGDVAMEVTVADEPAERELGLSGVESLKDFEGKLFIFDAEGDYGFWMKDMLIPIDIIWFNDDMEIVHIEENVTPDSYPKTFYADEPARFVLETNAYFIDALKIDSGSRLILPPEILPGDVKDRLQR